MNPTQPVATSSLGDPQSVQSRQRVGQRRNTPMRAESIVKVTDDFAMLIREASLKEAYKTFSAESDSITILDAHNSVITYMRDVLPQKDPTCLTDGKYRCCEMMKRLYLEDYYDPTNLKAKWRMIVRNLREIDGLAYAPRQTLQPQHGTDDPRPNLALRVREFEPAPQNPARDAEREGAIRQSLYNSFNALDSRIKNYYPSNHFAWPTEKPSEHDRWNYTLNSHKRTNSTQQSDNVESDSNPNPIKRTKVDDTASVSGEEPPSLPADETCVICLENRRTHAFLHSGLSAQDVTSHFVSCSDCANTCRWADTGCPICRLPCINVIRILK